LRVIEDTGALFPGRFDDRGFAGRLLADALREHAVADSVVVGLPRGGVEVAEAIAVTLEADLDVLVARKLRAPQQPELAIGALAEGDVVSWNEDVVAALGLGREDRRRELERVEREIDKRVSMYRALLPRTSLAGRHVVLTDDGVATGATLRAATEAVMREQPARLVISLPGGPRDTLEAFAAIAGVEEVVALASPEPFYAVGQLYVSFPQVSDERVCEILRGACARRQHRNGHASSRPN